MRKTRTIVAFVLAALLLSSAAFATMPWLKLFSTTYKPKPNSALAKAKCAICHIRGKSELNAYGTSLGTKMDVASLKAVEKLDADKDKFSNIAEIKAGTLPGDVASKPAKPAKPCKPAKPKK